MIDRLVKYCARKYNAALGAPTLQLGTLEYYRAHNPRFAITDPGEATHTVAFREGVELKLTPELGNRLFGGNIGSDGGDLTMVAHQSGAHLKATVNNAYIFCVSRCTPEDPPSLLRAVEFDSSYDSMWEITDRLAFRDAVGAALLEGITLNHLTEHAIRALASVPIKDFGLQVRMLDKPVEYLDSREHKIEVPDDAASVPDYKDAMARAVFTKEKRDERQREHRFVYLVTHPRLGYLSVKRCPIQIPLNRLNRAIQALHADGT